MEERMENLAPTAPTTGPPAVCPSASAWLIRERTVARVLLSMFRFSHALSMGLRTALTAPMAQKLASVQAKQIRTDVDHPEPDNRFKLAQLREPESESYR